MSADIPFNFPSPPCFDERVAHGCAMSEREVDVARHISVAALGQWLLVRVVLWMPPFPFHEHSKERRRKRPKVRESQSSKHHILLFIKFKTCRAIADCMYSSFVHSSLSVGDYSIHFSRFSLFWYNLTQVPKHPKHNTRYMISDSSIPVGGFVPVVAVDPS